MIAVLAVPADDLVVVERSLRGFYHVYDVERDPMRDVDELADLVSVERGQSLYELFGDFGLIRN